MNRCQCGSHAEHAEPAPVQPGRVAPSWTHSAGRHPGHDRAASGRAGALPARRGPVVPGLLPELIRTPSDGPGRTGRRRGGAVPAGTAPPVRPSGRVRSLAQRAVHRGVTPGGAQVTSR
ncbi:hypothetical protein CURTO8I2_200077 [Curtobacterium sp. 8I-2]|nr:hypothetical protein CURTO8I2_200077 [Curtobacterium sp. 8I-2]